MIEEVKYKINTGVKIGLIYFIFFVLSYYTGVNPYSAASITSIGTLISIGFLFYAVKKFRDDFTEGVISYGNVFKTTVSIAFFYASFTSILCYLFTSTFGTDVLDRYKKEAMLALSQMSKMLNSSTELQDSLIKAIEQSTLFGLMLGDFQNKIIGAILVGLIFGFILKKDKSVFIENKQMNAE
jgi:hypothetical protein